MTIQDQLAQRYKDEGIDPLTKAFAVVKDKKGNESIYLTVAGMEIKAMRTGLLCGKDAVIFGESITVTNPHNDRDVTVPQYAIAKYSRYVMDKVGTFASDPVQFSEYAKDKWHFDKGFMFLAKVARACALRHAFPDIFAGVISSEEAQCQLEFSGTETPTVISNVVPIKAAATPTPASVDDVVATVFGKN